MPSQKVRVFARGMMATGTTGNGWICWTPVIVNTHTTAVRYTQAASVGAEADIFNTFSGILSSALTKIPYTNTQLTNGSVQGRLVSGCLRVRYAGAEDLRSGIVSLFEDPDHLAVDSVYSNTTMGTFDSCGKERVSGEGTWHQINWSGPAKQAEQEYIQSSAYSTPCILISINGTVGAAGGLGSAPFEWEVWENLEFLGRDVVGKTNNMLDPTGTSHVIGAAKAAQSGSEPLSPSNPKTAGEFVRSVLAPVPGGSMMGNLASAAVHTINPGLGRIYDRFRNNFNRGRNYTSTY